MSLIRSSMWAAGAAVLLTAARFALVAILARRLPQVEFGEFAYALWLIDLSFLVCSLGATGAASRYIAEWRGKPSLLAAFLRRWRPFSFGLPIMAGLAVLIGAHLSALPLSVRSQTFLLLWAVAQGVWAMQTASLTGFQRFDKILLANAIAAAIMLSGVLFLPLKNGDPSILFGLMAISATAASVAGVSYQQRRLSVETTEISGVQWTRIRAYAANMWLIGLLWSLVWSRGELPIVRHYLGDYGVAHYTAAMMLFGAAIQGAMLAVSGISPELTKLWGSGQKIEALSMARRVTDLQLLLCGCGAIVLIGAAPELLHLLFGSSYRGDAGIVAILSCGLISLALACHNYLLQISTAARFTRNTLLLGVVVLFGTAWTLARAFGLDGAAVARAGTMLALGAVSIIAARRHFGAEYLPWRNFVLVSALVLAMATAVWVLGGGVPVVRGALAAIGVISLCFLLRDSDGHMQSVSMMRLCTRPFVK